jgi:branched-chain amino acid aminotransferase
MNEPRPGPGPRPGANRSRPAPARTPRARSVEAPPGPLAITVERTRNPRPRPAAGALGFGSVFTDHMFVHQHREGHGWQAARIVPYAPLALDPAAAALHYGQAMFEGMKAYRGVDGKVRLFRPERHCRRLARGAARLCMPAVEPAHMLEALRALCDLERDWVPDAPGTALYLRPTLLGSEAFLGVRPAREYLFFIIASPCGDYWGAGAGGACRVGAKAAPPPQPHRGGDGTLLGSPVKRLLVEERDVRAGRGGLGAVKAAANYAAGMRASQAARAAGWDEVLWTDAEEHQALEEAGTMNLFVHLDGEIVTPALDGTILGGITRESIIALFARWGRPVRERRITMDEVLEARRTGRLHEMWGCGTGAVITAIGELGWRGDRIPVGDGGEGPLARRLLTALREIQTGAAPDPDGWMVEV